MKPSVDSINKLREGWSEVFNIPLDNITIEYHEYPKPEFILIRFWKENHENSLGIKRPLLHCKLWDATTGKETEKMMCIIGDIQTDN